MSNRATDHIRKAADFSLILCFMITIWLPFTDELLGLDKSKKPVEKRQLASRPDFLWHWEGLLRYPPEYEAYFNDHFGFRNWLINWHNRMKVKWLGEISTRRMVKGKDGWYFFTGDMILEYCCRATEPFSRDELMQWQRKVEQWRDWLAQRKTKFLLVIVPNKHTVYSEYLPEWVTRIGDKSRLEQLVEHMKEHSDIELLDLRDALFAAKKDGRLHHRTDTHWNDRGAYVAYREIMLRLGRWFENVKPKPRSSFIVNTVTGRGGDLAVLMGQERSIKEDRVVFEPATPRCAQKVDPGELMTMETWARDAEPVVTECPGGEIKRAVVFRDSYCNALIPFLSEHFGRVTYIWRHELNPRIIEHEQPDIVIFEVLERMLTRVLHKNEANEADER